MFGAPELVERRSESLDCYEEFHLPLEGEFFAANQRKRGPGSNHGVRPAKLVIKYPVRIAINPFISNIGLMLPALISGEALVGMVMGLPTIGPLLLQSLLNQDMFLAGSMLMWLAILVVFGILLSDLLLAWVDPRIRFE